MFVILDNIGVMTWIQSYLFEEMDMSLLEIYRNWNSLTSFVILSDFSKQVSWFLEY